MVFLQDGVASALL